MRAKVEKLVHNILLFLRMRKWLIARAWILVMFLSYGFSVVYQGHLLTLSEILDHPLLFQKTMSRPVGPNVGIVKILMIPTRAFVVGDAIDAVIEVKVFGINWMENETCMVEMLFADAICYIDSWSNITMQDWRFVWWEYQAHEAVYVIYHKIVTLWYVHEGFYGLNITVWQPALGEFGYNEFYFPDLVQIKPYTYIEDKRRSQFAEALNLEILGLTYITIGPVAAHLMDLIERISRRQIPETSSKPVFN